MNLNPLPADFATTRDALHQVAFFAVSPARYRAVGRMGLRAAPGGFGTPEFNGRVVRVEGDMLISEEAGSSASQTVTTVRDAAAFLGVPYEVDWFSDFHDPLAPSDPDAELAVHDESARAVGHWFGYVTAVLEELQGHGTPDDDISEIQLWPEHFDPATELGSADAGQRASFGGSPGDGAHAEPYLYVAAWGDIDRSNGYWNDDSFNGSSISYSELATADDPVARGVEFMLEGYRILHD